MTQVVIDFPDSLFKRAEALAQRAKLGNRDIFLSVLDQAPDVDAAEEDKL